MATGKLPPRQKMIGMMYLVLTALLALNVSREILDAFVTVNTGLENTGRGIDKDIGGLYAEFDARKSVDPMRVMKNWQKAQQARQLSKAINQHLDLLKKRLIRETEGFKQKEEDTIRLAYVDNKDNYDIPTQILIGASEDGSMGEARILKNKLNAFSTQLLELLNPESRKNVHLNIDTKDPLGEPELKTWELKTFYNSPLAATVTLLSKIQDDVKSAESDIVDALLRETEADIIPFDTVAARVVAQSNYVLLGEEYQADIFLAAFNKTLTPQIYLGKFDPATGKMTGTYDSVKVDRGIGKYTSTANREGFMEYNGVINMRTPKGQLMQFPFKSEYIVARPALTVSADKMNVFYTGLENPVSVSVPGVPNEKLRITCDNGILTPQGGGKFIVTKPQPGKSHIVVTADMGNGQVRNMGSIEFRVKSLPKPYAYASGITGSNPTKAVLQASSGIIAKHGPDFEFEASVSILSFTIEITYNMNGMISELPINNGPVFNQASKKALGQVRRGDRVTITNIKAKTADERIVTLDPITFKVQ